MRVAINATRFFISYRKICVFLQGNIYIHKLINKKLAMKKLLMVVMLLMASINFAYSQSDIITAEVNRTNSICPISSGNGVTMTHLSYDNGALTYHYIVDEDVISMSQAKQNMPTTAEAVKNLFESPNMEYLTSALKQNNEVIVYRYTGKGSYIVCGFIYNPRTRKYTFIYD